ncbi:hypothetical protein L226DRAFT_529035 [Lentinus tigrinus ALCF2SS1-7]|uniref:Uncharacterized protein n=1 Tax=Lentinus tigrinus ALCF2SS1-6 TaxID=1328759 RepID=A0A5C2SN60_9APHY|nr:hypothetical protein L227DRAFT_649793 [Lentinus tigrinus ALCF2SS1-6]RPD82911.1 hypothetical protein L226DRAFT_529035 [Lentinus tigrinus ALCF2SS1-7]
MPPHRKNQIRRTATLTGSFYDKSGAINDGLPSPTATSFRDRHRDFDRYMDDMRGGAAEDNGADSDDEYTLTGYGEMSTDDPFTLPPSPTQTIKYRYRAYRPKLAKLGKKYRTAANGRTPLKTKSSAYHPSDYSSVLGPYLSGLSGRSPKRDFQALMQRYRDSAEGWRDSDTSSISPRKGNLDRTWSASNAGTPMSTPTRRGVAGAARARS